MSDWTINDNGADLVKVMKWFDKNIELFLTSMMLISIVVIMFMQVVMRYVFNNSFDWPEELSRYLFIWFTFIGISYIVKHDLNLKIDVILEYVGPKLKTFLSIVRDISVFIFSIFMLAGGLEVYNNLSQTMQSSVALGIPFKFVYLSIIVGFSLALFRMIQKYVSILAKMRESEDESLKNKNVV